MTIATITTETLPFALIDGIGMFTIFPNEAMALELAVAAKAKSDEEETGEDYAVVLRKDGKFLVVAICAIDEVCYYIPTALVEGF